MAGDVRDFGIAVAEAKRINALTRELATAFAEHPLVEGDRRLLRINLSISPGTPEDAQWVHESNCEDVACAYMVASILDGLLPIWVRFESSEAQIDPYAFVDMDRRCFRTGVYKSFDNGPERHYLDGRPLWIKLADWDAFLSDTLAARYGERSSDRAPSVKGGRPPSDDAIIAKADEMNALGMRGRDIASKIRLEPGFENAGTVLVRSLIKGRYKSGGRPPK